MNYERVEPIRPQLPQWEVQRRNQLYKNWGRYQCYWWRGGQPVVMVTAPWKILAIVTIELLATWKLVVVANTVLAAVHFVLLLASFLTIFMLLRKDPGVSSSCLPVANQQKLLGANGYCRACRIYCEDGIQHCPSCDCCIRDSLFHSTILQRCITVSNYPHWSIALAMTIMSFLYAICVILFFKE